MFQKGKHRRLKWDENKCFCLLVVLDYDHIPNDRLNHLDQHSKRLHRGNHVCLIRSVLGVLIPNGLHLLTVQDSFNLKQYSLDIWDELFIMCVSILM